MKYIRLVFLLFFYLLIQKNYAQQKFTISGNVKDSTNGESLIGAAIFVKENANAGTTTNAYGFYSLTLPQGKYTLIISYVSYSSSSIILDLNQNINTNIQLKEERFQLQEVVVTEARTSENVKNTEMSVHKLDIKTIKAMPALLGEVDVIRSLLTLPGVTTVGEGSGGFNVRGGSVDQNLILQDEAIIYNTSHLFGFFSVFNPDAVKDVKLYKGGIPSMYGGRLSSVLDVRLKDGNSKKFAVNGGIGLISSRVTVEIPIIKNKSSLIISGRRSYADLFLKAGPQKTRNNTLYFYDLSAKWNYNINEKNTIYVSGYFGRDVFKYKDLFGIDWGNATGTARWNHIFSPKLFSNLTLLTSDYNYNLKISVGTVSFDWKSNIKNYSAKADFTYFLNTNNTISFGAVATYYKFKPGAITPGNTQSFFNAYEVPNRKAVEYGVYIDNEQKFGSRLSVQYGLRLSAWDNRANKDSVYQYAGTTGETKNPVNPTYYGKGSIQTYINPEPRASLRFQLNETSSFKASYNRMVQYVHLISNTTAASPLDFWWPTTNNTKPETADQEAFGYFRNFKENTYEASAEVFYKTMTNQIDYINGAETRLNKNLEGELLYGQGRAYGLELYVKKNTGKINGWISYTLSKSERQINGLNNNDWYRSKYDRTHNLSIVGIWEYSKKWQFSAQFAYATGVATTFPSSKYTYEGLEIPNRSDNARNNFRVPAYHRLDIAATLHPKPKNGKERHGSWSFSIYNLYARQNAFSVYFQQDPDDASKTQAVRLSIFGSMIPSATYNFRF